MKLSELKLVIQGAVKQALTESAFEQYDEAAIEEELGLSPGHPDDDIQGIVSTGASLEEKMKQVLVIALEAADAVLHQKGDRAPFVQKAVDLLKDEDFSGPDDVEAKLLLWMERELPAMSHRHGFNERVKNVALNVVHGIISDLKKMFASKTPSSDPMSSLHEGRTEVPGYFTLLR